MTAEIEKLWERFWVAKYDDQYPRIEDFNEDVDDGIAQEFGEFVANHFAVWGLKHAKQVVAGAVAEIEEQISWRESHGSSGVYVKKR